MDGEKFEGGSTDGPVSYTHLVKAGETVSVTNTDADAVRFNVYELSIAAVESAYNTLNAVSYTHLDVYKRQYIFSTINWYGVFS